MRVGSINLLSRGGRYYSNQTARRRRAPVAGRDARHRGGLFCCRSTGTLFRVHPCERESGVAAHRDRAGRAAPLRPPRLARDLRGRLAGERHHQRLAADISRHRLRQHPRGGRRRASHQPVRQRSVGIRAFAGHLQVRSLGRSVEHVSECDDRGRQSRAGWPRYLAPVHLNLVNMVAWRRRRHAGGGAVPITLAAT